MTVSLRESYLALVAGGDLKRDEYQLTALDKFESIAEALSIPRNEPFRLSKLFGRNKPAAVRGLYLWGGVGCGKSMLMDMFFDHIPAESKQRVHFLEFMEGVHKSLHEIRKTDVSDAIPPAAKEIADSGTLLCLDEMQVEDIADAMIVGRLFSCLYELGVTICTTSNRVPEDLYKDGLNRHLFLPFVELLNRKMDVHQLESRTDYRQNRMAGEQKYFVPANEFAAKSINALWSSLAGGEATPLSIGVAGRELLLPRFRNGAARASFWDLCAQPLGPNDFLAIARVVRVLVLEDIPLLSRLNYNEAKRFVMLVDALYDAGVQLIASAAAVPEKLYIDGEGSFQFERAASRLREMQSADWSLKRVGDSQPGRQP